MRTAHIILATWLLSVHGTPIQIGKHYQRRVDSGSSGPQPGQQLVSPCPDLIDPHTGTTALYFYQGTTTEQRRSTLFVNDHWGLPGCCKSQLTNSCPPPPNPQPVLSPCPELSAGPGRKLMFYYLNAYTTDQLAANYILIYALQQDECHPSKDLGRGSVSSSPAMNMDPQAGYAQSTGMLPPSNPTLPLANNPAPKNPAFEILTSVNTEGATTVTDTQDLD